jgi:hypothetical protein
MYVRLPKLWNQFETIVGEALHDQTVVRRSGLRNVFGDVGDWGTGKTQLQRGVWVGGRNQKNTAKNDQLEDDIIEP